jgi:hypothetical protein
VGRRRDKTRSVIERRTKIKNSLKYFLICIVIFVAGTGILSCQSSTGSTSATNNDVINYRDFYLSAESVNLTTFTEGTIFVRGDKEKPKERWIQISARVDIDVMDWGGVSFNIPQGWEVNTAVSDYPQGNPNPENYTQILRTGSKEVKYHRIIEVGHTRFRAVKSQGGKGSLIIELIPESPGEELPETIEILIGIGSKGDYTSSPVHETFEIPLNVDYRTTGE